MNAATTARRPGPWMITTILHNHVTHYAVARPVGGRMEYVCANGRPQPFTSRAAAVVARRTVKAAA